MERKTVQNFTITLDRVEVMPFIFFLSITSLPVELTDKWISGRFSITCSLTLPMEYNPSLVVKKWQKWIDESIEIDYATLN